MAEIKAIETQYNGYRFRSRLEARWAVFFDAAGIKYEYEPEGFATQKGVCYLPDFYLPNDDVYVEVKPPRDGYIEEIRKARAFVGNDSSKKLLVLQNIPEKTSFDFYWYPMIYNHPLGGPGSSDIGLVCFELARDDDGICYPYSLKVCSWMYISLYPAIYRGKQKLYSPVHDSFIPQMLPISRPTPGEILSGYEDIGVVSFYNECYKKARQSRFEHGEKG